MMEAVRLRLLLLNDKQQQLLLIFPKVTMLDTTVEEDVVDPLMGAKIVQAPSHPLACDTSHPLQGSPEHKSSPIVDSSISGLLSPQPPPPNISIAIPLRAITGRGVKSK